MRMAFGRVLVVSAVVLGLTPLPSTAATRAQVLDTGIRVADRLAAVKPLGRGWEDVPYLVGTLLLADRLEQEDLGSGRRFVTRVAAAVGEGDSVVTHGDYAAYAQAALYLYRLTSETDAAGRAALLRATDGPFAFALQALRVTPATGPPAASWWVEGGYGVRFWQDDFFTLPPWLALRGSTRDGLPGDPIARDLAYEWIESYVFDHRPSSADARAAAVPTAWDRAGPLLWDANRELFRHDPGETGRETFWGRGNGWAAFGLVIAARYLDAPYAGARYATVLDRAGLRDLLTRLAGSLAARRTRSGGWAVDLLHGRPEAEAETSATGLITFMLCRGVNEGWLDRSVYLPIVLKSFALLLRRIDEDGDVLGPSGRRVLQGGRRPARGRGNVSKRSRRGCGRPDQSS